MLPHPEDSPACGADPHGLAAIPLFLVVAGFLGVVVAFLWRVTGRGRAFPFGPALALALFVCLVLPGPTAGL